MLLFVYLHLFQLLRPILELVDALFLKCAP